jgi:LmbE family N-acetylglucosaminyl deacetylase
MKSLNLVRPGEPLSVLCLGAHADDIEIGVGGTLLEWIAAGTQLHVLWCVLSASGQRGAEARASADAFLNEAASVTVELAAFRDGFFPYHGQDIKEWIEGLRSKVQPDVIFTHCRSDAHQDHREVSQLTWNAFRDHLILEYEIPKWDGDLGQPNIYSCISAKAFERKINLLHDSFATQRAKDWFDPNVFRGLARLRGMECRAPEQLAEAFVLRKARLS